MELRKHILSIYLAGICAIGISMSAFAAGPFSVDAYEFGPGIDNLSASDKYARYQWGLRNDGDLEYIEVVNKFEKVNPALATLIDVANAFSLELPKDIAGPDAYTHEETRAIRGVDINIKPAWEQYENSTEPHRPVIVAVIDTGIDISHPEIADSIWVNEDEIPDDGIDNDKNGYIDDIHGWNFFSDNNQVYVGKEDDHGTHAAGTIAARRKSGGIAGIADPDYVKIMSVKALGSEAGVGNEGAVINAIQYAEANGASICNLSFGTSEYFPKLEQVMRDSNMLFIVSAGNGDSNGKGINIDVSEKKDYPSAFHLPNIISVANLMFDGSLAESSNYGPGTVHIAAPGVYIVSTISENGYGYMSGTSMSAPMVTGIAAMVYYYRTDFTLKDVRDAILGSARRLYTLDGKVAVGGIPNAYAAMNYGR